MKTLFTIFLAGALASPLAAQSPETERQLLAARDTIWRAWFSNDTALLRRFLPPAAATLEIEGQPRWSDRPQIVRDARSFAQAKSRLVDLKFANTNIVQTGNSALVRSSYQTIVASAGRADTTRGRATELFVLLNGTWVNPYWALEPLNGSLNDAGREIPLPDTLGADFPIADSAAKKGTLADYDALLGTWEFRFQSRRQNGTFNPTYTGHWTFEKKPGGALIEDRWRPDDPAIPMNNSLHTYRNFDPERKVWQMVGMSSRGGEAEPGLTWSDDKHRYAIQRGYGELSRIRYLKIDADHFLWRSDVSVDGGRTWLRDAGTMEAHRISK